MDKGEHTSPEGNQVLVDIANVYSKERLFVYITHRKYSYSVDPSIYLETSKIKSFLV